MTDYTNGPLADVAAEAQKLARQGATVYQKFTCAGCGARLTIDVPNTFYTSGHCEECNTVTDLTVAGCNMLVILAAKGDKDDQATGSG